MIDLTWKPGTVVAWNGRVALETGQRWGYFRTDEEGAIVEVLVLVVVSHSAEGEVVLRPDDPLVADRFFPEVETTFKDKPVRAREGCPFKWVDEAQAKGSKGQSREGDLLAHEGWDVWTSMHLHGGLLGARWIDDLKKDV